MSEVQEELNQSLLEVNQSHQASQRMTGKSLRVPEPPWPRPWGGKAGLKMWVHRAAQPEDHGPFSMPGAQEHEPLQRWHP